MKIANKICNKSHDMWHQKAPTIAFLGDSVTQGCFECYRTYPNGLETEFDYQSAYSTRFKEILNIIFPYTQINIINAGVSGGKAADGVAFLEREGDLSNLKLKNDINMVNKIFELNKSFIYISYSFNIIIVSILILQC